MAAVIPRVARVTLADAKAFGAFSGTPPVSGPAVVAASLLLAAAPVAHADEAFWGGWYRITFQTTIDTGACQGTVTIPVTAVPS